MVIIYALGVKYITIDLVWRKLHALTALLSAHWFRWLGNVSLYDKLWVTDKQVQNKIETNFVVYWETALYIEREHTLKLMKSAMWLGEWDERTSTIS